MTSLTIFVQGLELAEQQEMGDTCGKDDVVRVNWRLVQAPVRHYWFLSFSRSVFCRFSWSVFFGGPRETC